MRSNRTVFAAFAVSCSLLLGAAQALAGAEEEVSAAEDARYEAIIKVDEKAMRAIFADEFVYHQPSGNVANKESYIEGFKKGDVKVKKAERYDVKIHIYGDTATAMGQTKVDLEMKGEPRQVDLRYLNVWVKRDGRWQIVSRQSAFKPKPQ